MDGSILVVADDAATRDLLASTLGYAGFQVCCARDVAEARTLTGEIFPDVVLLDRMVQGPPALSYVRQLRSDLRTAGTTIIVIGPRVPQDRDVIAALESGADDYIDKPFLTTELLARVRAVVRRRTALSRSAT